MHFLIFTDGKGSDIPIFAKTLLLGYSVRKDRPSGHRQIWTGHHKLYQCKPELARQFVLSTQDPVTGGLAKWTDTVPDPLHTYLGLSGLAIAGEQGLLAVDPALNISTRAANHLASLHQGWAQQ